MLANQAKEPPPHQTLVGVSVIAGSVDRRLLDRETRVQVKLPRSNRRRKTTMLAYWLADRRQAVHTTDGWEILARRWLVNYREVINVNCHNCILSRIFSDSFDRLPSAVKPNNGIPIYDASSKLPIELTSANKTDMYVARNLVTIEFPRRYIGPPARTNFPVHLIVIRL